MSPSQNKAPPDIDLFAHGIAAWASRVRQGQVSFQQTALICLQRIEANSSLDAFEYLDADNALAAAEAFDTLLNAGSDMGPFMGLPIGIKDIMVVTGMPTSHGSNADISDITGTEGRVVKRFRSAGAIPLGKTRTVEFALGASGVNESRGTPWNPADRQVHRIPGGSSSGSAVATAAGLLGMALGSDTGGSIRIPACFTGITGHKSSTGQWPLDGIFPLSPTLDSIGPLCRNVADAALVHTLMTGEAVARRASVAGLRLGIPDTLFLDDLDDKVAQDFEQACQQLEQAGAVRVPVSFPEVLERQALFTSIVPAELISHLSPERFEAIRGGVDTVTAQRAAVGLDVKAHVYVSALRRRQELIAKALKTFQNVDLWLTPSCPFVAMPLSDLADPAMHERSLLASRNTQPGNLLDFCGLSIPMHRDGLPTGLQLMMPHNKDAQLLATGLAVEAQLGKHVI